MKTSEAAARMIMHKCMEEIRKAVENQRSKEAEKKRQSNAIKSNVRNDPDCNAMQEGKGLSKKEHGADALALGADERRDKLRKAAGRSKYPMIRGYLNGETHMERLHVSVTESIGHGGEPGELKHLSSRRKRKKNRFP